MSVDASRFFVLRYSQKELQELEGWLWLPRISQEQAESRVASVLRLGLVSPEAGEQLRRVIAQRKAWAPVVFRGKVA